MRPLASIRYRINAALYKWRLARTVTVAPLVDLACPVFSLDSLDPIGDILKSREYADCTEFFLNSPALDRALISPNSQALLYVLTRHLRPQSVVEIGSYRASTTEALARALQANGAGVVHTIDPYGRQFIPRSSERGREFFAGTSSFTPSIQWLSSRARRAAVCRPDLFLSMEITILNLRYSISNRRHGLLCREA